jgi:hypothetical protein
MRKSTASTCRPAVQVVPPPCCTVAKAHAPSEPEQEERRVAGGEEGLPELELRRHRPRVRQLGAWREVW